MIGKHLKRRKDKYNPYRICERVGRYYLSFKDGQGVRHEMEIQKDLFNMLNRFELDYLSILNEWDRHIEHFEQTEQSFNRRACCKTELVEDTVLRNIEYEQLHKAISMLTETQQRRSKLYYFQGLTYKRIVDMEDCSTSAVVSSISAAIVNIRKILSK
ncbi:MAG: sigma-70 family RNA polymerase sigma factor [Clostridiales bacterium]|nr:sigma-70 family RNA polymerase sigma factor [Clostridiales bacterium]